ncbi:energy transducer TonB [Parapedobacter deserti]|uniref:Energy transducer TonB n=1 Tax=Parapedobacter deserti TaxID=1912957 RepID=A0ABV7JSU3_9SPHI
MDHETQIPLQGVVLQLADNHTTVTDSSGAFTLEIPSHTLTASYFGYEQQQVLIAGLDSVIIALQPATARLDEIVVVGYDSKRPTAGQPKPAKGWRAYNRYLKRGIKQAEGPKGVVTLAFTIDDNGTPTGIRVVRTTDAALSEQAIHLVREGPKWQPGKRGDRQVE